MPVRDNTKKLSILFALAACVLLSAVAGRRALAAYPERIIKIVVPFAPGGGTDVVARTLAQEMAKDLGASVIIENKPGAGTIIGTQAVATSEPDGYTLLMGTFANAVNPSLNAKLPYDPHKDFAAGGADGAILQYRRGQSGVADQIDRGSDRGGQGRARQALLRHLWHRHVGASGRRTVQAHGEGQSDDGALQGRGARDHRPDRRPDPGDVHDGGERRVAGRSRAVARARGDFGGTLAGISAIADGVEAGVPGYAAEAWYGLYAPAKTPPDIIDRLNKSAAKAVQSEAFKKLGVNEGLVMVAQPPEALDRYFRGEEERWRKVIQDAGIKIE